MSTKQASLVGTIDSLLATLGTTKSAEAMSEPGSQGGATTHPSKSVDDQLQTATEGSHSATNEADVKKDQPLGVDKATEGGGGSQQDKQVNIGITSKPTGEDSAAETDSAKAGKDDPGSSHPARTDNDSLDGMKYASQAERFRAFAKQAEAKGTSLTAAIAASADDAVKSAGKVRSVAKGTAAPAAPAAVAAPKTAAKTEADAGTALAETVTEDMMDKQALDALLIDAAAETVAMGEDAAIRAVDYLRKCARANLKRTKKAEGDDSSDPKAEGEGEGEGGEEESGDFGGGGGGEAGPSAEGGGDPSGGASDDELMAALSGDGGGGDPGMGGGDPTGGMGGGGDPMAGGGDPSGALAGMAGGGGAPGGADPMSAGGMGGGDPMGGMGGGGLPGGMPPDAGGGAGPGPTGMGDPGMGAPGSGGELSPEEIQMLTHVLAQAGVTPEQLEAAAVAKQAAEMKAIKSAGKLPNKGAWRPKSAEEAKQAEAMLDYVLELTGKQRKK